MGQTPMRATLLATPVSVPAAKVSFVVANTGALVHELVILPLPADGPGTRPTGSDGKIDGSTTDHSCRPRLRHDGRPGAGHAPASRRSRLLVLLCGMR